MFGLLCKDQWVVLFVSFFTTFSCTKQDFNIQILHEFITILMTSFMIYIYLDLALTCNTTSECKFEGELFTSVAADKRLE